MKICITEIVGSIGIIISFIIFITIIIKKARKIHNDNKMKEKE